MKKEKIEQIDIFRAIACVFVIVIHSTATGIVTLKKFSAFSILITVFNKIEPTVPAFIFVSGLVLHHSYKHREIDLKMYFEKRLRTTVVPYLMWSAIYYTCFVISGTYALDFKFFIKGLLNGSIMYHLYFMIIIIQFYVLYPILKKIYNYKKSGLIVVLVFMMNLIYVILSKGATNPNLFFTYLIYFSLGCVFANNLNRFNEILLKHKRILVPVTIFIAVLYISDFYFNTVPNNGNLKALKFLYYNATLSSVVYLIYSLLGTITTYYISMRLKKFYNIIKPVGDCSLNIYLAHPLILAIINKSLDLVGLESMVLKIIISFVGTSVITFMLVYSLQNIKKSDVNLYEYVFSYTKQ